VLIGANPWLDVVVVRLRKPDSEISRSAAKLRLLKRLKCTLKYEKLAWATGAQLVCGVDEVGRGAFFGPVVAGAVILDPKYRIKGLRDSKLLPAARRDSVAADFTSLGSAEIVTDSSFAANSKSLRSKITPRGARTGIVRVCCASASWASELARTTWIQPARARAIAKASASAAPSSRILRFAARWLTSRPR